ncbi:copper homeostasis protein cutC homolog isoform 1-T1 [Glossina fuscipes fuscipes]
MSSSKDIKLEVCVDSIASAIAAAESGAARLELCSALSEGGLTPTIGILKSLKGFIAIPIYCMLRPRSGDDFIYTDYEMQAMLTDLDMLREQGADGFVFGSLTNTRSINVKQCQQVLEHAKGLPVTFHRAFDITDMTRMQETVRQIIELGFKRILTSGFKPSAHEGIEYIAQLIAKNHRDIIIMPGAGIRVGNLEEILTTTKCVEFHSSAKSKADAPPACNDITVTASDNNVIASSNLSMDCDVSTSRQDLLMYEMTDANVVRKLVFIAKAMSEKN